MMRLFGLIVAAWCAMPAAADTAKVEAIVATHVLPGYQSLAAHTAALSDAARAKCTAADATLVAAYHDAFDAWIRVSHLRFGPSEQEDRAFALAFWPDPRGSTPKALASLIRAQDPAVANPEAFGAVSIAARGLYALEALLFDPQITQLGPDAYRCALVGAVASDIAATSQAILAGWTNGYADVMTAADNDTYRSATEAARQVFTALSTGLEFTSQTRLGRPLGSFDRPRPNRAEARRSGRSLRHVILSLNTTRALAGILSGGDQKLDQAFADALARAHALDDPVFAGVQNPAQRFKVEVLQQDIEEIREILAADIGPSLGVSAGFNALDGD